ncbi:Protein enhanced disease resistance 4 [Vitis vinifera]|nr:Protein enhanced disease resistance 4 [Vitis vinifera]
MAEGSKVRVVRCPKCENLLPELPDYPVYQCGGCGAVLRAKKKAPSNDALSEKSDDENGRGVSEKLESLSEKGAVS